MDPTAVNTNVTVDDFDSIVSYPDQSQWTTPDPSSASYHPGSSQWLLGTYHSTSVVNASVSLNFTGPAIYIYGASGPSYGSYEVNIDGSSTVLNAFAPQNATPPYLLYGANNLTYAKHSVTLTNLGDGQSGSGGDLLFDFLRFTVQLGPAGSTVTNKTLQETDPSLTYSGTWGNNKSGNFSGGGSAFTQGDNASVQFQFEASAIYVFGDKKNDHGLYTVSLADSSASSPPTEDTYDGISGCGGEFGMTCEQQQPTLAYFASNLPSGNHTLTITNLAGANKSFFDLDSIVLTVPSEYAPRNLSAPNSGVNSTASPSGSGSAPSSLPTGSRSSKLSSAQGPLLTLLLMLLATHLLRRRW